jgi:hypothetical protein
MDRVDHQSQRRIDDRPRLLVVEASISSVEPLMSANSAVTVLRSPSEGAPDSSEANLTA